MARTAADILLDRLIDWGVDTIFAFPGDGINGIFESLRARKDKLRYVQVRHEEAAAFAACGYAKFAGRLGVCLATSGPGGIHLLNGLYDAKMDGQSVLAITGHTFHDLIGCHFQQDGHQEQDSRSHLTAPGDYAMPAKIGTGAAIERVSVSAYSAPTDAPEADGTASWDKTGPTSCAPSPPPRPASDAGSPPANV